MSLHNQELRISFVLLIECDEILISYLIISLKDHVIHSLRVTAQSRIANILRITHRMLRNTYRYFPVSQSARTWGISPPDKHRLLLQLNSSELLKMDVYLNFKRSFYYDDNQDSRVRTLEGFVSLSLKHTHTATSPTQEPR